MRNDTPHSYGAKYRMVPCSNFAYGSEPTVSHLFICATMCAAAAPHPKDLLTVEQLQELKREIVARKLAEPLPKRDVSHRPGPGGRSVPYLEYSTVNWYANEIFGPGGWDNKVLEWEIDVSKEQNGWYSATALVRMSVTDKASQASHEDFGSRTFMHKNRGEAKANALKAATTDALKRALRHFGPKLGSSIYDKGGTKRKSVAATATAAAAQPATKRSRYDEEVDGITPDMLE